MSWWSCLFEGCGEGERPGGLKLTERGVKLCGFRKEEHVLDAAGGDGTTVQFLSETFGCCAEGIDLFPRGEKVLQGDVCALPYPEGSFDGCCMECALSQIDDPDRALSECCRVLRPGGRMFFTGLYARAGGGYEKSPLGRLETRDQLVQRFEKAGFIVTLFEDHTEDLVQTLAEAVFRGAGSQLMEQLSSEQDFRRKDCGYCLLTAVKDVKDASAVIAAAGLSSRMGEFKQLLKLGEYGFTERIVRAFRTAGVRRIAVVTGHRAEDLKRALCGYDLEFLHNPDYASTEMLDSARIGFRHFLGVKRLLFCPSDVPMFREETVRRLLEVPLPENGKAVVYPRCGEKTGHPVLIGGGLLDVLLTAPGDGGLRKAFLSVGAEQIFVPVEDPGTLLDADTPEAYEKLKGLLK